MQSNQWNQPPFVKTSGGRGNQRNQGILGFFGFFVFLVFFFNGCTKTPVSPEQSPLGPITATGTISATGTSLIRRGTHVLLMEGRERFFLESRVIDLNEFQGTYAAVHGELSANTSSKFLPVIQVLSVDPKNMPGPTDLQSYTVPALSLALQAPAAWKSSLTGKRLLFTLPTESEPFIAVEQSTITKFPEGIPVRVNGRNGVRVIEEGGAVHRVFVQRLDDTVTLFTFGPKGQDSLSKRDAFYSLLTTVKFSEAVATSSSSSAPTGSGQPCGGPAGVLCPAGEYCEVKEMDTGIGTCRGL